MEVLLGFRGTLRYFKVLLVLKFSKPLALAYPWRGSYCIDVVERAGTHPQPPEVDSTISRLYKLERGALRDPGGLLLLLRSSVASLPPESKS